jgi:hypothetical protein
MIKRPGWGDWGNIWKRPEVRFLIPGQDRWLCPEVQKLQRVKFVYILR